MKKIIILLIFSLIVNMTSITFADALAMDEDYIKYQNALYNVAHDDTLNEEMKEVIKELIEEKYYQIVNQKDVGKEDMQINPQSYPPFKMIAKYSKKVSTIKYEANQLMALGSITSGLGYFAKKMPLIGTSVTAAGAIFSISGGLMYLSVQNLKDNASYTGENWFRWTDEKKYEYQVYNKTYVTYRGSRISKIVQTGIIDGDFNE